MNAKQNDAQIRWDDLRLLLVVSRSGSLLAAGREVDAATSTVSRRLARLERELGMHLLERRADGVRLTDAGRHLAETAEALEFSVAARLRELPPAATQLAGTIRVTSGDGFAEFLVRAIAAFVERHPRVSFEIAIESRALDLRRREADLAIRTVHGREGSLVYRTLGALSYGLWASAGYVEKQGAPRSVAELAKHELVGFAPPLARLPVMRWLRDQGATRFTVRATTFGALLAAVHAGLGIAALPEILGDGLTRILPRTRLEPLTVYLVTHPDARRLPHVRAFSEILVRRFQELAPSKA